MVEAMIERERDFERSGSDINQIFVVLNDFSRYYSQRERERDSKREVFLDRFLNKFENF